MGNDKQPCAFVFWYKSSELAPTEYIYIIAFTEKQARFFYSNNGYTKMFDYSLNPVNVVKAERWTTSHEVGDILGQYARI